MPDAPADPWQFTTIRRWGMWIGSMTRKQGYGILRALERGDKPADVARAFNIGAWEPVAPSDKQVRLLAWKVGPEFVEYATTIQKCSLMIDAKLEPLKCFKALRKRMDRAKTPGELDAVGRDVGLVRDLLPEEHFECLVELGQALRLLVGVGGDIPD